MITHYKILDVNTSADKNDVKKAYRKLALKHHPDRNQGNLKSEEEFKKILTAYEILSDENKRAIYDKELEIHLKSRTFNKNKSTNPKTQQKHYNTGRKKVTPDYTRVLDLIVAFVITGFIVSAILYGILKDTEQESKSDKNDKVKNKTKEIHIEEDTERPESGEINF